MAVQWAGASSIMTALNFLVTIITMRAPGMTFWRMPLLVWANFTTSLLVVIATPFIAGSQFFVMFDRVMHTNFFNPGEDGYVLGYQHIFWFYSHPAVYIMMLPGFGIASEVISTFSRKPIFGYRLMALSLMAILVLGFSVWAHHMFVSGMATSLRVPMMVTTLLIAIPTGIKVFSWLATLWEGRLHFRAPMLWALGFVSMFVIGGLSGIMLGAVPIDIYTSDTYFIVAHIHYVLLGGSLFTIFAGIYYWFPKMTGRMYNETLAKVHFWLTLVAFNATFFPMHIIGVQGMPRRVPTYEDQFANWNLFISISSFVLGASFMIFVYNMIVSWKSGPLAPANPWRGMTIEWRRRLPTAGLQLRRGAAGRGQPVRVRRQGRSARDPQRRPRGGRARTGEDDVSRHVLVIANETAASSSLLEKLRERAAAGDPLVTVIAPVNQPSEGYVVYEDTRRASAGPPARPDARAPSSRPDPRERHGRRGRPRQCGQGRARAARAARDRDRRLDASQGALGLAPPQRRRAGSERCGRPAGRARRRGQGGRGRADERARGRQPDALLGAAPRADSRTRGEGPRWASS